MLKNCSPKRYVSDSDGLVAEDLPCYRTETTFYIGLIADVWP
jgi:hypothetical protein